MTAWNKEKLFIHIPKTAGRSITKGMGKVNKRTHAPISDPNLPNLPSFTVIRNPYDRAVSWWKYSKEFNIELKFLEYLETEFTQPWPNWRQEFIDYSGKDDGFYLGEFIPNITMLEYICIDGKIAIDEILRFEELQLDVHLNKSKFVVEDYKDMYCEKSKKIVEKHYGADIEYFKYKF